jgi:hypothetical protein
MRRRPPQGRSLADRVPEVAGEWHPTLNDDLTPHDVFAGSAEQFWFQCSSCGHEWRTKLEKRVRLRQGCRKCSAARRAKAQATPKPGHSLADLMPELAAQWHPTLNPDRTPYDVVPTSGALVWWRCPSRQHEWRSSVYRRSLGIGCRKCAAARRGGLRASPKPGKSFADMHPDAAAEWHRTLNGDLKPADVKPGSNKRVWWECQVRPPVAGSAQGPTSRRAMSRVRRAPTTHHQIDSQAGLLSRRPPSRHRCRMAPNKERSTHSRRRKRSKQEEPMVEVPNLRPRLADRSRPPNAPRGPLPEMPL